MRLIFAAILSLAIGVTGHASAGGGGCHPGTVHLVAARKDCKPPWKPDHVCTHNLEGKCLMWVWKCIPPHPPHC